MIQKPFPQSYWVYDGLLCAGCYPGDLDPSTREAKFAGLLDCGIRQVLSLMEETEKGRGGCSFDPYEPRLRQLAHERQVTVTFRRFSIRDGSIPTPDLLRQILACLDQALQTKTPTYLHCWGGHGRTSTVVACHLIQRGRTAQEAIDAILAWRADLPKNHYPFEGGQAPFIHSWEMENIS